MADGRSAARLASLSHALVHRDHLSPQAAWRVLCESYALDCTLSEVEDALETSSCAHCPASAPEPARRQQSPAAAVHQQSSGWLTSQLGDDAYG
jgi:hypothetical protein